MRNIFALFLALIAAATLFACGFGTGQPSNSNANGPRSSNATQANLPPGMSTEPIQPSANSTPGIPPPGEANKVPVGATPTPGIPDPANLRKPMKPGLTPTPGIPSEEEIRRQMNRPPVNVNAVPSNAGPSGPVPQRKQPGPVRNP